MIAKLILVYNLIQKGSAGTHNGMKSIINDLNSTNINRLRIGIGPVPEKKILKILYYLISTKR